MQEIPPQEKPQENEEVSQTPLEQDSPSEDTPLTPPQQEPQEQSQLGPVVGILIIIAVIILGGLYFYGAYLSRQSNQQKEQVQQEVLSQDQELISIEEGLNATDIENLDKELGDLDKELQL